MWEDSEGGGTSKGDVFNAVDKLMLTNADNSAVLWRAARACSNMASYDEKKLTLPERKKWIEDALKYAKQALAAGSISTIDQVLRQL